MSMQPKGRLMYIEAEAAIGATRSMVPWSGKTNSGGIVIGAVSLYDSQGNALKSIGTEGDLMDYNAEKALVVANIPYYAIDADDANVLAGALSAIADAAAFVPASRSAQITVNRLTGFNGATYDRLRSFAGNADNVSPPTLGLLGQAAFQFAFDGTNYDRVRSGSAANLSAAQSAAGSMLVTRPGDWSASSAVGAGSQATITRAAGAAGVRHICTSIYASLIGNAAATIDAIQIVLRDGATAVGPVLWSGRARLNANSESQIQISGLNIVGSVATAMTLEFSNLAANAIQTVSLTGYDCI